MTTKTAREIRAEAWAALGENGQYLRYVAAFLLLTLVGIALMIPITMVLGAGIGMSGIAPYLAPGGHPEIGLFTDPAVMLPLLVSALVFSLLLIYPIGFLSWGGVAMAMATSMPAPIMPSSVGVKPSWSIGFFATPSVMRMT